MPAQPRPLRVLVADDDVVGLQFFRAALSDLGCETATAASGAQALAHCAEREFDLLLLDRRMPDFGGAELLARIRSAGVATPAIATTADTRPAVARRLRQSGFDDVIVKPLAVGELQSAMRDYLPSRQRVREYGAAATATPPLLDDEAAISTSGSADVMKTLRELFARELQGFQAELPAIDAAALLRERLHRLRASCGFCGATVLAGRLLAVEQSLDARAVVVDSMRRDLFAACAQTLGALQRQS